MLLIIDFELVVMYNRGNKIERGRLMRFINELREGENIVEHYLCNIFNYGSYYNAIHVYNKKGG